MSEVHWQRRIRSAGLRTRTCPGSSAARRLRRFNVPTDYGVPLSSRIPDSVGSQSHDRIVWSLKLRTSLELGIWCLEFLLPNAASNRIVPFSLTRKMPDRLSTALPPPIPQATLQTPTPSATAASNPCPYRPKDNQSLHRRNLDTGPLVFGN